MKQREPECFMVGANDLDEWTPAEDNVGYGQPPLNIVEEEETTDEKLLP